MLKEFFEKIHKNQDLSALQLLKKNESRFTSIRLIKFQDIVNSEFLMLESISGISLLRLSHIKSYDSSKYNRFYKSYLIFLKEAKNWAQSLGFNITETNQYGLPALRFQIYGVEFRLHADNVLIEKSTEDLVLIDPR
jgi:hypothetical protein